MAKGDDREGWGAPEEGQPEESFRWKKGSLRRGRSWVLAVGLFGLCAASLVAAGFVALAPAGEPQLIAFHFQRSPGDVADPSMTATVGASGEAATESVPDDARMSADSASTRRMANQAVPSTRNARIRSPIEEPSGAALSRLGALMGDSPGANYGHGGLGLSGRGGGGGSGASIAYGGTEYEGSGWQARAARTARDAEQSSAPERRVQKSPPRRSTRPGIRTQPSSVRGNAPPSSPAARIAQRAPLPRNAVLASNFVGGNGVHARLSDLLDRGVMVGGEHVRLEAFKDRDPLPYPVPQHEAVATFANLERSRIHAGGDTVHLQVALMARKGEAPARPRLNVRLVIDASGSMTGPNWTHALGAAHALVDRLTARDTLGIVRYSDDASWALHPTGMDNKRRAHSALDVLIPGGGTNMEAALELTARERQGQSETGALSLVVLISDGQATIGHTDAVSLSAIARRMFDANGTLTTSIGLGANFDEQTMLSISREGSGSYHFVRRPQDISEILQDELEDRIQAVAQALRLRVVLGPGVIAKRVYGSRLLNEEEHAAVRHTEVVTDSRIARELGIVSNRRQENEEGLRIHLPTFRRGDQHVVLIELEVPAGSAGSTAGIAQVYLEYKDLIRRRNGRDQVSVNAERMADPERSLASVERTVKRTVLSFQAGETLQQAADLLNAGDHATAARLLQERTELLEAAARLWRDPDLRADAALLGRYRQVLASAWPAFGGQERQTLVLAMNYFGDQRMR